MMPRFRLLLLGPIRLTGERETDSLCLGAKAQALLAYVARQPNRQVERERAARLIWECDDARHALRQTLLVLRRQLGAAAPLVVQADAVTLRLGACVATDIADFEDHLAQDRVEAACALWRGPFCEGLNVGGESFADWLTLERARIEESVAGAFEQLARQAEAEGRSDVAVAAARRLVALDPLNDAAQARLIALYRGLGWTGAARLAHRRCVGLFHRELGVAPGAEVQAAARRPPSPRCLASHPAAAMAAERRGWRAWAAAGLALALAGVLAGDGGTPRAAAGGAWVAAGEWRPGARAESGDVPLEEAIARALGGEPEFAHLYPAGC